MLLLLSLVTNWNSRVWKNNIKSMKTPATKEKVGRLGKLQNRIFPERNLTCEKKENIYFFVMG